MIDRWTHGVADRFEEEEREEAPDARLAGRERDAEAEHGAPDPVQRQHQRGVDEVEQDHADEAVSRGREHSQPMRGLFMYAKQGATRRTVQM